MMHPAGSGILTAEDALAGRYPGAPAPSLGVRRDSVPAQAFLRASGEVGS